MEGPNDTPGKSWLYQPKTGPIGDFSYALILNPYHVIRRAHIKGRVQERKWQSLVIRANEIGAFDVDDIDDEGNLIPVEPEEEEKTAPRKKTKLLRPKTKPAA